MKGASQNETRLLRKLMGGSSIDKDQAETRLKEFDPSSLPDDILELWMCGNIYDKYRAGRVKEAWTGMLEKAT